MYKTIALLLVACGGSGATRPDLNMSNMSDMAVSDLSTVQSIDMVQREDLESNDLLQSIDMTHLPDMTSLPDLIQLPDLWMCSVPWTVCNNASDCCSGMTCINAFPATTTNKQCCYAPGGECDHDWDCCGYTGPGDVGRICANGTNYPIGGDGKPRCQW